jgi:hypothetical protein
MSVEFEVLLLYYMAKKDNKLIIDEKFWGEWFLLSRLIKISFKPGRYLTPEGCLKEMEECIMEKDMKDPQTKDEFLFWSWNNTENADIHPTYHGYDDFWRLRHQMMSYHYNRKMKNIVKIY